MTGPEHYKEAERLARHSLGQEPEAAALTLQHAQVHATLALAVATALGGDMYSDRRAWYDAAGVKPT